MKRLAILFIIFFFVIAVQAEEADCSNIFNNQFFNSNMFLNPELDVFSNDGELSYRSFNKGQRIGASFLNIFFGLGSLIMGDSKGGLIVGGLQLGGILFFSLGYYMLNSGLDNLLDLLAFVFGGFLMPLLFTSFGVILYITGLSLGFITPFSYDPSVEKHARLDDTKNWEMGITPQRQKLDVKFTLPL